ASAQHRQCRGGDRTTLSGDADCRAGDTASRRAATARGYFGMNVLVIGSGGREHALAWAIAASPLVDQVYCAPGNAGIAEDAECIDIAFSDIAGLIALCRKAAIDFVVVGPEAPLVGGLVDV